MTYKVAVIVNKTKGSLGPSETFLLAHINGLPCRVVTLIGNPGYRLHSDENQGYLQSRALLPLGLRWVARQLRLTTAAAQDTKAVSRFLEDEQVSAVLAEYGPTAASVMDACRKTSVPLIAHFHGFDAYREYYVKTYADDYRKLFQQASAVVAVSQHMRDQLISLGASPDKTFHNSCGADIPDGLRGNPGRADKRFLIVGRLTAKKAPDKAILAFSQVAALHPDAMLDIIGDGPLRQECEQLCESLGLTERVILHGAKSHEEVMAFFAQARCFVQHSVHASDGDHEGTPVGVLEAMGMGLPVVATRHGGIMDVVDDGSTGSLVDEYDVDGMAQAMIRYADDPALAQSVGDKAREALLANWTSEKSVGRLWNIIEQTLSR